LLRIVQPSAEPRFIARLGDLVQIRAEFVTARD
jgi:hypothetical protein